MIVAEALAAVDDAQAPAAFGALANGRVAADAKRALARLDARARGLGQMAGDAVGLPGGLLAGPADDAVAAARLAVTDLFDAARGGNWDDAVASLRDSPPHEGAAGPATLHAAALIAEGRGKTADAAALDAAALNAAGGNPDALSIAVLARIAEGDGKPELRVGAMELAAARFTQEQATVALAVVDSMRARLADDAGDRASAAEHWRAALVVDPGCLPAARAIRRDVARRGDLALALDATEAEAACLRVPEHRVHALLLAAALAEDAARGHAERQTRRRPGDPARVSIYRRRAIALLRAVLEIDPGHEGAFEQLRTLLGDAADVAALSAALAARIAAAANPFEVTSLRLARAELLAGTLGDRAGARAELDAILHKQPEHPRALARLSELLWDEQAWSDAGEVYLRRTGVEREPAALRESFLRLGHIYRERVPDARRAITAYERVRGIEPDNREALQALSELYLAEGDTKQALPVTERLVATEADAKKRTAYRVRLGDLLMRAGDLRRAGTELRRAVDGDPRNVAAVTTLAHLLERARDPGGRRALLDHTVGLLRHDVERGELNLDTLRALVALLTLRDKPRAAAAVADLVAVLAAAEHGGKADRPARPGRSLVALRQPELDERSFPPGLPPGIRQIMRLVGPHLRPSGGELAQHLARHGVSRSERAGRGEAPRPLFDSVGAELAAGDFELYVATGGLRSGSGPAAGRARIARGRHHRRASGCDGAGGGPLRGGADVAPLRHEPGRDPVRAARGGGRAAGRDHPPVRAGLSAPRRAGRSGRAGGGARRAPDSAQDQAGRVGVRDRERGAVRRGRAARRGARRRQRGRAAGVGRPAGRACGRPRGVRDAQSDVVAVADRRTRGSAGVASFRGLRRVRRPRRGDGGVEAAPPVIDSGFACLSAIPVHRPTIR